MEIKILDMNFKLSGVIDSPRVLRYSECFCDAGALYMELGFDKEIYEKLRPPCRVLVEDLIFNVERRWYLDGVIRVYGVGIFAQFKEQYVSQGVEMTAKPSEILHAYASKMVFDGVNYRVYSMQGEDERVYSGVEWCESLYSIITRLCYEYSLGFRVTYSFDKGEIGFHILDARDRASAQARELTFISDRMDVYSDIETEIDLTNYKNKVELVWRINALDEVESFVFERVPQGEGIRGIIDDPPLWAMTETELRKVYYAKARELFRSHRKKHRYKVRLMADPKHRVGDICYVESTRLGERDYALLTEREVEITDTRCGETLVLEVQ